jgi:hypothetical protein
MRLRGPECALRFPGRADFDTLIENSFAAPDGTPADVPASLWALPEITRRGSVGFIAGSDGEWVGVDGGERPGPFHSPAPRASIGVRY